MDRGDPLVRLVRREELNEVDGEVYDRVTASRGGEGNVFRAMANSVGTLERVAALGEFVRFGTSLDRRIREAVIIVVAHETQCEYEWTHHERIIRSMGLDPNAIVQENDFTGNGELPHHAGDVLKLARALARDDSLDDNVVEVVRGAIGDAGIIEVAVTVGYYMLLARVIQPLRIPLDPGIDRIPLLSTDRRGRDGSPPDS